MSWKRLAARRSWQVAGRYGVMAYVSRVTQDVDMALAADRLDEFIHVATVSGFEPLPLVPGRWPKLRHKETGIEVDLLPEGGRPRHEFAPGADDDSASQGSGAAGHTLQYIRLPALIELKLAAGRARDDSDVVELIRANPDQVAAMRAIFRVSTSITFGRSTCSWNGPANRTTNDDAAGSPGREVLFEKTTSRFSRFSNSTTKNTEDTEKTEKHEICIIRVFHVFRG